MRDIEKPSIQKKYRDQPMTPKTIKLQKDDIEKVTSRRRHEKTIFYTIATHLENEKKIDPVPLKMMQSFYAKNK